MGYRAVRPLNRDARRAADEQVYRDHADDPRPNPLYDEEGRRRRLDPDDHAQADLRRDWLDAYEANGGEVERDLEDSGASDCEPDSATEHCPITIPALHMHLDADRDGRVDDDIEGLDEWQWGPGGAKGAIILCNSDDDNEDGTIDNQNDVIDGADDVDDLAPLVIRKTPENLAFPSGWIAELSVSNNEKIRIFRQDGDNWNMVIGPSNETYTIEDLNSESEMNFRMEAVQYPNNNFDGEVTLHLEVRDGSMVRQSAQEAKVRVAPWIMTNHLDETEEVFVVRSADSQNFVNELSEIFSSFWDPQVPLREIEADSYPDDRWIQDVMEFGFSSLPKSQGPDHLPVVIPTPRSRTSGLDRYPLNELVRRNFGYSELQSSELTIEDLEESFVSIVMGHDPDSLSRLGNLECSPRVTVNGKDYLFGRIIFGHDGLRPMDEDILEFLRAQRVQEPFPIDTSWLYVGHADEVISFCPWENSETGFKIVMPSPERALEILRDSPANARLFAGTALRPYITAGSLLDDQSFVRRNRRLQTTINDIEHELLTNLGLENHDDILVKLPVLFRRYEYEEEGPDGRTRMVKHFDWHEAYTSNVVNMLVVTISNAPNYLCIPKPYGPCEVAVNIWGYEYVPDYECEFEKIISDLFEDSGNTIRFVDCYEYAHNRNGEVHCVTNGRRKPPTDRWWWQQEGIT